MRGIRQIELRHFFPLLLVVLAFFTGWSVLAAQSRAPVVADYCSNGGLELILNLETDNGLSHYKQALELVLTGGARYSGKVRQPYKNHEQVVDSAHCRSWMKVTGHELPRLMKTMQSQRGPASQSCEKRGQVQLTYRNTSNQVIDKQNAIVCFRLNSPANDPSAKAFRKLYESAELFVSGP